MGVRVRDGMLCLWLWGVILGEGLAFFGRVEIGGLLLLFFVFVFLGIIRIFVLPYSIPLYN